jgi:hypothetical protein
MQSRSIPSVTLYIRITDEKGNRRYERVNRRKPQTNGIYCLHFYEGDKRRWVTVGTNINAALKARMTKESELLTCPVVRRMFPPVLPAVMEIGSDLVLAAGLATLPLFNLPTQSAISLPGFSGLLAFATFWPAGGGPQPN